MRGLGKALFLSCLAFSCKTTHSRLSSDSGMSETVAALWQKHVDLETSGKQIQPDCMPRFYAADPSVPRKGMVMFFHGFTACPQQYFAISERLKTLGYDVYLPLMPGQGRTPLDGPKGSKDNHMDLPSTDNSSEYPDAKKDNVRLQNFVKSMNEIAAATSGDRILAGLSGGGGLATGAAADGQGIWTRVLLYAPYYKNPGLSGFASAVLDQVMPGFVNDWGQECRDNRIGPGGRAGLCSLSVGAVRAMTNYGINASARITNIKVPIQFVGVVADPTADNTAQYKAFESVADHSQYCLYPLGVPHSIINPASDAPKITGYWVPAMQQDSIDFITQGKWFPVSEEKAPEKDHNAPICRYKL